VEIAKSLDIETIWTTTLILLAVKKKILNKNKGRETLKKSSLQAFTSDQMFTTEFSAP
jgi:hypothetical protein